MAPPAKFATTDWIMDKWNPDKGLQGRCKMTTERIHLVDISPKGP